ncbi:Beta-galactosidase 15 [Camellia lanceoleosa]|nr:Beta-galactosidase 15 [Camellia lanceoleosa]
MFGTRRSSLQCLAFALTLHIAVIAGEFFKPFNVTYDHRALIIDGKRRMLNSAGIKIQLFNFQSSWGFPVWLHDVPGIVFRTDNAPFKDEMHGLLRRLWIWREEMLFSWQSGPIIMLQSQNSRVKDTKAQFKHNLQKDLSFEGVMPHMLHFDHQMHGFPGLCLQFVGGTNFGRTAGGPNYITSYNYDAPIDEYGLLRQPRWGHLKDLHDAIKLCELALVLIDSPQYMKLGPKQEVSFGCHECMIYGFILRALQPQWSVSILPDCRNTVFNTAKVYEVTYISKTWLTVKEPIGAWGEDKFTVQGILEHLNVTKDRSDYLWYTTSEGSVAGHWVNVDQPSNFKQGYNDLVLLSETIGLQNYGAFLEKDGAGFNCPIKLIGFRNGDIDLSNSLWTYQMQRTMQLG